MFDLALVEFACVAVAENDAILWNLAQRVHPSSRTSAVQLVNRNDIQTGSVGLNHPLLLEYQLGVAEPQGTILANGDRFQGS